MRGTVSIANKRPRLAPNIGSPDVLGPHSAPAGFGNQSSPYSFRLDVDMSQYGTNVPPVTHAHSHPSLSALYNGPGSVSNVHSATSSQPAFFPQAPFDPPRPLNPPTLRSVAFSPQSSSSYPQQQQNQGGFPHQGRPQASQHGTSTNWFVELLNTPTEPAGTHHPPSDGHLSSFSWPVHVQQTQTQHENGAR
ncbi:hypothetical protein OBBRIDRAFT_230433 [Obba rivulosa]|uniref:Uncharacterized protein n=1 Tax=Obba rivulosa TaxID=1052685 RepID=A0A8E2J769_9APHY|nr:hypothetical protein OBBRIDRAFT_230433 [Obba rivulosa]